MVSNSVIRRLELYSRVKQETVAAASDVARTILQQLGGSKFIAMTGAKGFVAETKYLKFSIGRNKSGANTVIIRLNSKDLYDIELYKYRKLELKLSAKKTDVSVENLRNVFESMTELRTSL
jgi:hypothetical protein